MVPEADADWSTDSVWSSAMKQRSKRDSLNINVRVCEPGSTQPCGHIIDLSMNGLSISGRGTPLPVELSTLQLLLPWPMHGFEQITLQVEQRWLEFTDAGQRCSTCRVICSNPCIGQGDRKSTRLNSSHV